MTKRGWFVIVAVLVAVAGVLPGSAGSGADPARPTRAARSAVGAADDAVGAAATTSETFMVGPFDLAPGGQPGDQVNRLFADMPRPEGDLAIRGITWRLVDAAGNPADPHMVHLHHIVLLDTSRRDQLCSFPSASRFAGTGMELNPVQFPDGYAYHSEAGAPWQGVYHVMNMGSMPAQVSIEYTVEWSEPGDLLDVEPYFFDVTGCWGDSTFDVPGDGGPGSTYEETNEYTMTRQGRFVAAGGHLHEGGVDLSLTGPTGEVCRATVLYHGTPPHMGGIEPCGPLDEQFEPGDPYTLTARYQNHEPIPDAMGIMISYLHHTDPDPPEPEVDVEFLSLDARGLRVSLSCANVEEVYLDAFVSQTRNWGTVDAWGYTQPACTEAGTVVTLPIEGYGVFTPGEIQLDLWASAYSSIGYAQDSVSGDFRASGRLDVLPDGPPDGGANPITIEGRVVRLGDEVVVRGVVECGEPSVFFIDARGWQRAGLGAVPFQGYTSVACDGSATFSVPIEAPSGRLVGGPAQVTIYAEDFGTDEGLSVASRQVILPGGPPPVDERPDAPESPLSIRSVSSTTDGVVVTLDLDDCPAGWSGFAEVRLEEISPRGARLPAPADWTYATFTCTGGSAAIEVFFEDLRPHRPQLMVDAYVGIYDGGWQSRTYMTWGEHTITR